MVNMTLTRNQNMHKKKSYSKGTVLLLLFFILKVGQGSP